MRAAETARHWADGIRGVRLLRGGAPGALMRSRRRRPPGCRPVCRSSRRGCGA